MISTIVNGFLFSYHADIIKVVFGEKHDYNQSGFPVFGELSDISCKRGIICRLTAWNGKEGFYFWKRVHRMDGWESGEHAQCMKQVN